MEQIFLHQAIQLTYREQKELMKMFTIIRAKLKFKEKEKLNEFIQERLINRKVGFVNKEKQSEDWN